MQINQKNTKIKYKIFGKLKLKTFFQAQITKIKNQDI
jgi:hypothetical protein